MVKNYILKHLTPFLIIDFRLNILIQKIPLQEFKPQKYCRSGNIREVLIFSNFVRTNSRILRYRKHDIMRATYHRN